MLDETLSISSRTNHVPSKGFSPPAIRVDLRDLRQDDSDALAAFECRVFHEPWTLAVELAIRHHLSSALEAGDARGVGLWDAQVLAGLAVWSIDSNDPTVWRCNAVATRKGYMRQGIGRRLKHEVIRRAKAGGARRVESTVHRDNHRMLDLNIDFGAALVSDPEAIDYFLCVIAL